MESIVVFITYCGLMALLATWVSNIASRKGYPAVGWWFAGFFFNWLALLVAACMPDISGEIK